MKCDTCKIIDEVFESKEPTCCVWYMDNVILGGKSAEDCDCFKEKTDD